MYADYAYYISCYLLGREGVLSNTEYPYWEKQARREIDRATFNRLKAVQGEIPEEAKDCTCAIAEALYRAHSVSEQAYQAGGAGVLVSYSNDGESGTFDTSQSAYTAEGCRREVRRLLHLYMDNTGLLYAGVM